MAGASAAKNQPHEFLWDLASSFHGGSSSVAHHPCHDKSVPFLGPSSSRLGPPSHLRCNDHGGYPSSLRNPPTPVSSKIRVSQSHPRTVRPFCPYLTLFYRRALGRAQLLRQNANHIPRSAFENRKKFMQAAFQKGEYLKDPEHRGQPPANPLTDPGGMDQMMNMMKGNMVMFIPQTVIMGWINFFFSGFVLRIYFSCRV